MTLTIVSESVRVARLAHRSNLGVETERIACWAKGEGGHMAVVITLGFARALLGQPVDFGVVPGFLAAETQKGWWVSPKVLDMLHKAQSVPGGTE